MRRHLIWLLGAALLAAGTLRARPPEPGTQAGELRILRNGQPIGVERYQITRTATEVEARGQVELEVDGQKILQSSRLLLGPDLAPRSYEWKQEQPKGAWVKIDFQGTSATIHYPLASGKEDQQVYEFGTARVALLDNNVFHHFLLLAGLYDYQKGGVQALKVFIPQAVQPGEAQVELRGVETLTVGGRPQPVRQLAITTEDNQLLLWVTEAGEFVRLQAPLGNVEVVPAPPAAP